MKQKERVSAAAGARLPGYRRGRPKHAISGRVVDQRLQVEIEQEEDGRWLAEVVDLPGVMAYGQSPEAASVEVEKVALRMLLDRLDHEETVPELARIFSVRS
jgi:predicted RNase H-like HicB family nuclease